MEYYPNADEVRDVISATEMPDEELETHWQESGPHGSGYYIPLAHGTR